MPTLFVNTTSDENDGIDVGAISLRDAILEANANPDQEYIIELEAGKDYLLTKNGSGEDAAQTGDLDITGNVTIRVETGEAATIDASEFEVADNPDRVFHVLSNGSLRLENVTVTEGSASGDGGGILVATEGTLTLTNSTISGNSADKGGGILNYGTTTITDSTISGNTATDKGGGIDNYGAATITNSIISGNYGNGIFNLGTASIADSTISENSADSGGGIFNNGTATITDSTISGNTADSNGGGIFTEGTATITNSTINGNTATYEGGGIDNEGTAIITNSSINGNSAGDNGGGIFNEDTATITSSTISGNSANSNGGGIFNEDTATITNSTISGNSANSNGGGIDNEGTVSITNSTITNNTTDQDADGSGDGGGIFNRQESTLTLANTIAAGNFDNTPLESGNIHPDVSGEINGDANNLIGSIEGATGSVGTGTDLVNLDPLLSPLQDNGGSTLTHTLLTGSSAIDAGNNSLVAEDEQDLDLDGNTTEPIPFDQRGTGFDRLVNGTVDIGAFEFNNNPPPIIVLNLGTSGDDELQLSESTNEEFVFTGTGSDTIDASVAKTSQRDRFYAGANGDELLAGENDRLFGGTGDDTLDAREGVGRNRLFGGEDNDILFGSSNDLLSGGNGDDMITGGGDSNLLIGGAGADTFVIRSAGDTIFDFETGIDKLDINIDGQSLSLDDLDIDKTGGNTTISFNDNLLVTLIGEIELAAK